MTEDSVTSVFAREMGGRSGYVESSGEGSEATVCMAEGEGEGEGEVELKGRESEEE